MFSVFKIFRWYILIFMLSACNNTKPESTDESKPVPIISPSPRVIAPAPPVPSAPVIPVIPVEVIGFKQQTYASWYQPQEHGIITASGEVYDYYGMTAGHQNLPLGSLVRVHYPRNGNAVTVKINDRITTTGIKLSAYAAEILGVNRENRPIVNIDGLRR